MRVEVCKTTEIDRWIAGRHYLKCTPPGAVLRLWVLDDKGNRIGAMMWGRPTARKLDAGDKLELTRMFMVDGTERCAESKALALARKHIRRHLPHIKGVIAYSSTGAGHEGTIYQADNWFSMGTLESRGKGWGNSDRRANLDPSPKQRWVRTP